MKVIIDIPKEFGEDIKDNFQDFFERVKVEIAHRVNTDETLLCGNYERETAEMLLDAFKNMQIIPKVITNRDMMETTYSNIQWDNECNGVIYGYKTNDRMMPILGADFNWWNAPYEVKE